MVPEWRYALDLRITNEAARHAALADELLAGAPDLLVGIETTARMLQQRTSTIPIVMFISGAAQLAPARRRPDRGRQPGADQPRLRTAARAARVLE